MGDESESAAKNKVTNQPLKSLGKYVIERKLGQGGMGIVYLAKHTDLKKLVALKVLSQDKAKNPVLVRRFKAEAQAAAQLEHPNIVAVYDTGEADGYLYIAMEYVEGIDLFEQVRRGGVIPVKRSIDIIKQVASALQHAFEQNIVHRDIKPSNLLLKHDGVVKVTDLGLARSIDDTLETNITRAGTTVGTVDYMAPEQARSSKAADIRSDIYSLGCTWYQMLTGEPPFPEGSLTNKLQAHATKPIPDPRDKNEKIPEGLIAVLQRMTAKKPGDRYQTPAELLDDLAKSKLTKAAFSNEIFSDLSDYEISADQCEIEGDDETEVRDTQRKRRARPRDDDDHEEEASKSSRQKKSRLHDEETNPDNNTQASPPRKRSTKSRLNDHDDDFDAEQSGHRPQTQADDSKDDESTFQSTRDNPRLKSRGNDAEEGASRLPRRSRSTQDEDDDEDESEVSASSKRKRNRVANDETKTLGSKNGKTSASKPDDPKQPSIGPKPLPPKRQPIQPEADTKTTFNIDSLKNVGILAGIVFVVVGLGALVFHWSNQIGTAPSIVGTEKIDQDPTITSPPQNALNSKDATSNVVNLVDASSNKSTTTTERPTLVFDIAAQPMPTWATSEAAEPRDLPVFSVGPGATSTTHFADLEGAFRAAQQSGGLIRLLGNGPFQLLTFELTAAKRVVLTATTPDARPLVIMAPSEPNAAVGLTLKKGVLDMRGVHFAIDRSDASSSMLQTMVTVVDGQLFLRNCSFTATGNGATTAVTFTSNEDMQNLSAIEPQILLDHVTVRGNGLTGLRIHRTTAEAVIQDSLFATGTAPAIDVAGHLVAAAADAVLSKPRRSIRIVRSTLCGRTQILKLAAEETPKPPLTVLYFLDSACSAEGSGNTTVLASATGWPSVTSTSSGWLTNLSWTSKSSVYLGFDRLLDLDKSSYKVAKLDEWQRVWGKKFESAQFQPIVWQESLISELSAILPHDFDTARIPYRDVISSKGISPGCVVGQLKVPGAISQTRLAAIGQRPQLPAIVVKPPEALPTRKVDLMKEDLGAILNKPDWPSGSVFEVSGAGQRTMTPARISGKSLRIIFRPGDGLRLQPRVPEKNAKPEHLGLFNIENGQLDLQSIVLESVQSPRSAAPPWLINSKNSSVILRGCQLNGPLEKDLDQHQGLIVWTTLGSRPGAEPNYLSISDSLLMTTGVGVRAECSQGNIFFRNSIVAVRGHGLILQPHTVDNHFLPMIDLEHVTFSASKSAIRVESEDSQDTEATPLRLFVDYCAIVPPLEFKPNEGSEAAIIECVGPMRDRKQIEWWGNSNGVAREVKTLLRQTGVEPITSASNWQTAWGDTNVFRFLSGTKGVVLENRLPTKWINLKASSFTLDANSPAASWADNGRAIGAIAHTIEAAVLAKKITPETKSPQLNSTKSPSIKSKTDPGF